MWLIIRASKDFSKKYLPYSHKATNALCGTLGEGELYYNVV